VLHREQDEYKWVEGWKGGRGVASILRPRILEVAAAAAAACSISTPFHRYFCTDAQLLLWLASKIALPLSALRLFYLIATPSLQSLSLYPRLSPHMLSKFSTHTQTDTTDTSQCQQIKYLLIYDS